MAAQFEVEPAPIFDSPPQRIALIRALHVGDLLLTVPALRSIRAGFPDAEITLIGLAWARAFADHPPQYLDRFVEYQGYPGLGEVEVNPERVTHFLEEQQAYGYDLVVPMHGNGQASTPFALALHPRTVVGYYSDNPLNELTRGAPYPYGKPEVLRHLGLAEMLGCPPRGLRLEFPLLHEDRREASNLLPNLHDRARLWVALHPGSRAPSHRWPAERFAILAAHFAREYNAHVVLVGGPGEEHLTHEVTDHAGVPIIDIAGHQTSLGGLAAILAHMDIFIGNDTGTAHLATAVDTPSVTIFGPAEHGRWAPLDRERHRTVVHPVACSPCDHWHCPIDLLCLYSISAQTVIHTAEDLLVQCTRGVC